MASDTSTGILTAALQVLRAGDTITLDSVAEEAGLTKPGLMYHFESKEALMTGVVDHVMTMWETKLDSLLGKPVGKAGPVERIRAYVEFCLSGDFDYTDLAMMADPRLREPLTTRWADRMFEWVAVPADVNNEMRGRLVAARLIADGAWFAGASQLLEPDAAERERVRVVIDDLLKE